VVQQDRRRDTLESSVVLRLGLPWETQAELRIPYFITDEEVTTTGLSEERRDMSGLGDIEVAFSKTLLHERGWIPQTVGTLRWNTGTDGTNSVADDQLSTGAGFNSLQGALTGLKTQDPLVFYGGLFYTSIFSEDQPAGNVDPGDSFGITLGTILAASPETSLRASLGQSFVKELNFNDRELAGTDAVGAVLELGLSSLLSQSTLLDVSVGVGLTQDAPDFQIAVSLPIQAGVLPFGQSL
jgi:hypothetical protein